MGSGYTDNGRVFAREDGSDLSPGQVTKVFNRLTASAGLRPVRLGGVGRQAADAAEAMMPARATTLAPDAPALRPQEPENDEASPPSEGKAAGQMRAACRNRTDDLLITSEMLYRLS